MGPYAMGGWEACKVKYRVFLTSPTISYSASDNSVRYCPKRLPDGSPRGRTMCKDFVDDCGLCEVLLSFVLKSRLPGSVSQECRKSRD